MKQLTFLLIVSFLFSCGKRVDRLDYPFAGEWRINNPQKDDRISIDSDGHGEYTYTNSKGKEVKNWGTARIKQKKDKLQIGFKSWKINEYPYEIESQGSYYKVMKLDDIYFIARL